MFKHPGRHESDRKAVNKQLRYFASIGQFRCSPKGTLSQASKAALTLIQPLGLRNGQSAEDRGSYSLLRHHHMTGKKSKRPD